MKRRKMAGVAAWTAVCLLVQGGNVPAYGAGMPVLSGVRSGEAPTGVELGGIELNPEEEESASVPMEMKATLMASLISVAMPADGFEFQVNPEASFDLSDPAGQITSPDVKIENRSVVPVKLEISQVEVREDEIRFSEKFSNDYVQSFKLVDTLSEVGPPGTAILVLGMENRQYRSSREFEHYAICPGKTGIYVAEIEAGGTTTLKLYGKAAPDFYGSYEFTVRPTLKISAVQANEPADSYKE